MQRTGDQLGASDPTVAAPEQYDGEMRRWSVHGHEREEGALLTCRILVSIWCPSEAKVGETRGNSICLGHNVFISDSKQMPSLS